MQSQVGPTSSPEGIDQTKYRGVRRRRWGKWVSEIRVPGTRERLWLGSYSNPEAAAVAHDAAVFLLRGPDGGGRFNFPDRLGRFVWAALSPTSVQRAATESGMAVDAEMAVRAAEGRAGGDAAGSGGCMEWENACDEDDWRGDIPIADMELYSQ